MTPQDTKSSDVTRRVTDKDAPHGSGKADGVYASVQAMAAVVAIHPSGIRPLVIGYSRIQGFLTARTTSTGVERGDPVCGLGPIVT